MYVGNLYLLAIFGVTYICVSIGVCVAGRLSVSRHNSCRLTTPQSSTTLKSTRYYTATSTLTLGNLKVVERREFSDSQACHRKTPGTVRQVAPPVAKIGVTGREPLSSRQSAAILTNESGDVVHQQQLGALIAEISCKKPRTRPKRNGE